MVFLGLVAVLLAASDAVQVADAKWRVLEAHDLGRHAKSNNPFQSDASSSGRFIQVGFELESLATRPDRIYRHPRLSDSRGRSFDTIEDQVFYTPAGKRTIGGVDLPPNVPKEFWAVYEVAQDADALRFEARTLSQFGDAKWISLQLTATAKPHGHARRIKKDRCSRLLAAISPDIPGAGCVLKRVLVS